MSNDVSKFIGYVCLGMLFLIAIHFAIPFLPSWAK